MTGPRTRSGIGRACFTLAASALLVDLDGVLVDSMPAIRQAATEWAARHDLDPDCVAGLGHGRRTVDIVRVAAPGKDEDAEVAAFTALEAERCQGVQPVRGARQFAAALEGRAWAIVTSGLRRVSEVKLAAVRLTPPKVLVCAEDVTDSKPAPDCYRLAARRLGVSDERCVVIEDAVAGFRAAQAAGMRCIGVGPEADGYAGPLHARIPDLADLRVFDDPLTGELQLRGVMEKPVSEVDR